MGKNILSSLLSIVLLLSVAGVCWATEDAPRAQKNLIEYITDEIQQIDAELIQPYRSAMYSQSSEELKRFERAYKDDLRKERKKLVNTLDLVKAQDAQKLPAVLVNHYVDEDLSWEKYSNKTQQYIQVLGEVAVPAIDARFDQASPRIKTYLLLMLSVIRSQNVFPIIRRGLQDNNKDVVIAALKAWHAILGVKTGPLFEKAFLRDDHLELQNNPDRIYLTGDAEWYDAVLNLSLTKNISLYDLTMMVNVDTFPANIVNRHADYLRDIVRSAEESVAEKKIAAFLLMKVDDKGALRKLKPLLPDLIRFHFYQGGIYESYRDYPSKMDYNNPFSIDESRRLSERIIAVLSGEELKSLQSEHSSNILLKSYFGSQAAQKGVLTGVVPETAFKFLIKITDKTGQVISSAPAELTLGQEQRIVIPAGQNGFPGQAVTLVLKLDREKWMFSFDPVNIDFKPHAVQFTVTVPFNGAAQMNLNDLTWNFIHD